MRGGCQAAVVVCHGIRSAGYAHHEGSHFCTGEPAISLPPGRREKDFPYGGTFFASFLVVHACGEAALQGVYLFIAFAARITKVTDNSLVSHFIVPFFPVWSSNRIY